ncbi:MAG: beta-mannosidase [Oscillospiraceae bacterium]|nr:beta-mannosidase [Oscillospiraceae bacterium]
MKKRKTIGALALIFTLSLLSSCGQKSSGDDVPNDAPASDTSVSETSASDTDAPAEGTQESAENGEDAENGGINAIFGDVRTEFNTSLDLSDFPLTSSDVPEGYSFLIEAESGTFSGSVKSQERPGASGDAFVTGINNAEKDRLDLSFTAEYTGFYDLDFQTSGSSDDRVNDVLVDDMKVGDMLNTTVGQAFGSSKVYNIYMEAGEHTISVVPSWGYIDIDCLYVTAPQLPLDESVYAVKRELSNPNADDRTKRLYKFLCDIYGKYSLAGQYADKGRESGEFNKITAKTGKSFAVLGLDVSNYSLGSIEHGADSRTVEYAYDFYTNGGGIVQLCWHWTSPGKYAKNDEGNPWYRSFYKEASNIELDKIMNGEDEEGYKLLMDDIDHMSGELARLRDAGVPVLWRPLHEASGGWFWWGNCSAESYKKLWNVMYDKMTNEHGLTNLIWVWNGQSPEWYPGDETVDIHGWDIYAGKRVDSSQSGRFTDMAYNFGEKKLIALTENGCVMDPDKVMRDNARWLFWGTWSDPFTMKMGVVINDEYTDTELLIKAYNHERVLTLDELPDLKNYE